MRLTITALAVCAFSGCSAEQSEDLPPVLEITSPERGSQLEGNTVTVTGIVKDDGAVRVTVAGTEVTPAADGSFSATITVTPGIDLIESHAIDGSGNDVRDVRAVMSGMLAPTDGSVEAPVAARAGTGAIAAVAGFMADTAEAIDFTAAVTAMNPVFNDGGCLGAVVNVNSVTLSNIDIGLVPGAGHLATEVVIDDVVVKAHAKYKVSCIGGSSNITLRASKARVRGNLGVAVSSGKIATTLPTASVTLEGFNLDASGIPGVIEDLVRSKVRKAIEDALTKVIRDRAPGMANEALAGMLAKPVTTSLLGHETSIAVTPSELTLSADGLYVAADTAVTVAGGEGGMFVTNPAPASAALMQGGGLGIAVADDVVNQLFAGMWATGAFDQSVSIESVGVLASLLDSNARTLDISVSLPPTVSSASGTLGLAVGDLMVTVRDEAGGVLQELALSLETTLSAAPSGDRVALTLGTPTIYAQVLAQSDAVDRPLTAEQVEGIVGGAWGIVRGQADDALANLPMPTVGGITLGTPTVAGVDGFVVADIPMP